MSHRKPILIGQLANHFGISPKTIRWYEANGLIKETMRSDSGYRHYQEEDKSRLSFIRKALALGFSIKQIREILNLRASGIMPCDVVKGILQEKIDDIDKRIEDLRSLKAELKSVQNEWLDPKILEEEADICPLVENSR